MTKTCRKKLWKTYYKKHKKRIKAKAKIWRGKNKKRLQAKYRKWWKKPKNRNRSKVRARQWYRKNKKRALSLIIKRRYGLAPREFLRLRKKQKNRCAACQNSFRKTPFVDHDHQTGLVRGLLCCHCNTGLGMFKDSVLLLQLAIKYLKRAKV